MFKVRKIFSIVFLFLILVQFSRTMLAVECIKNPSFDIDFDEIPDVDAKCKLNTLSDMINDQEKYNGIDIPHMYMVRGTVLNHSDELEFLLKAFAKKNSYNLLTIDFCSSIKENTEKIIKLAGKSDKICTILHIKDINCAFNLIELINLAKEIKRLNEKKINVMCFYTFNLCDDNCKKCDKILKAHQSLNKDIVIYHYTISQREKIIKKILNNFDVVLNDKLLRLLSCLNTALQFNFSKIKNVLKEIIVFSKRNNTQIDENTVKDLIKRHIIGVEYKDLILCPKILKTVAIHEVGHAFITQYFGNVDSILFLTVNPTVVASGASVTLRHLHDEIGGIFHVDYLEPQVMICLAGKAAQEVFGVPSTGCEDDLVKARIFAEEILTILDPKLIFDKSKFDQHVFEYLERCYKNVKEIISNNFHLIKYLADNLFDKRILFGQEFIQLINKYKSNEVSKLVANIIIFNKV
ncbi:MAG: hypothetical protein FWC41_00695 [Firmicutes bacterium]|nr:hypothetical protein [Bacillota bacterium]